MVSIGDSDHELPSKGIVTFNDSLPPKRASLKLVPNYIQCPPFPCIDSHRNPHKNPPPQPRTPAPLWCLKILHRNILKVYGVPPSHLPVHKPELLVFLNEHIPWRKVLVSEDECGNGRHEGFMSTFLGGPHEAVS